MKASNDVTETLRRTLGLMQGELERSVLSHQILDQSSATLRAASTQHDVLSSATLASRQLITALEKADWLDRLLICAALAFFALTVLFVLKQRVVDRGVRLAFWWTRFLPGAGAARAKAREALSLAMQEEGRVSPTLSAVAASASSIAQSITQSAKDALSAAITHASASPAVADTSNTFSESSSTLSTSLSSIAESLSSTILDASSSSTLPESAATTTLSTTTTTLDTLLMTQLSSVRHPEL